MIIRYCKEIFRPRKLLSVLRHYRLSQRYKQTKANIGLNCILKEVELESYTFIGENSRLTRVKMGKHSYTNIEVSINLADIGNYVSIGSHVLIGVGKHPVDMVSTHPAFYSNNKSFQTFAQEMKYEENLPVEIGHDVWIGSKATVMGGLKIGTGAIVAYGAIVTRNVPPYSIVGGIPARIFKYRFDEDTINRLLEIKWWELSDGFMELHHKEFQHPSKFIQFYMENKDYCEGFRIKKV
jgi:acetyltransferase-like isoleucine patch superfamily enzyme